MPNPEIYYADGKRVAVDDVFCHKSHLNADPGNRRYLRVTKITPARVYCSYCYPSGELSPYGYIDYHSHRAMTYDYVLVKRLGPATFGVKKSGFAKFVNGCDTGKYGKKRRAKRVKKIEIEVDNHAEIR